MADIERKVPIPPDPFPPWFDYQAFYRGRDPSPGQQGKLSLDDPLSKLFRHTRSRFDRDRPAIAQSHRRSCLTPIPGWMFEAKTSKAYTTEQLIAEFKDLPAPAKPARNGSIIIAAMAARAMPRKGHRKSWTRQFPTSLPIRSSSPPFAPDGADGTPGMAIGYTDNDGMRRSPKKFT